MKPLKITQMNEDKLPQNFKRVTLYGQFLTTALKEETVIKARLSPPSSDTRGINRRPDLVS